MEELTDRNSYAKATNADGICVLEATVCARRCATFLRQTILPVELMRPADHMSGALVYPVREANVQDHGNTTDVPERCKAIAPFVEKMMKKYPDVRFYYYNTDTAHDIAHELGVNQMPTFNLFKDGDLMGGVTGAKASELEKMIKENYDGKVVEEAA